MAAIPKRFAAGPKSIGPYFTVITRALMETPLRKVADFAEQLMKTQRRL